MKKNKLKEFVKNPRKSLFRLAYPIVIAMVVQTMYNIVDTAFVGRLGAEAIAALTFCFPLFIILIAIDSGVGTGTNSRIARYLGQKCKKAAENTAMHGILLAVIASFTVYIVGRPLLKPLFSLFGASETVSAMGIEYMSIILLASFFMFLAYIINAIFAAQGDTKTPMKLQVSGLILNTILDPIFIYWMKMGIKGAALATMIGFIFSFSLGVYYIRKASYLHIHKSSFHFSFGILKDILRVGMPSSLNMVIISLYVVFLNRIMAHFSTNYVAAFGISARLESIAVLPVIAISIATLTLVGMFHGARRYDLLKDISWYSMRVAASLACAVGIVLFAFPALFLRIFTSEQTLLDLGIPYLRIYVFTIPFMAFGILTSRILQGMGYGLPSLVISLVRIFIVAIPLAYIFVFVLGYGYLSVAVAMVIGGLVSNIVGLVWLRSKFHKLRIS